MVATKPITVLMGSLLVAGMTMATLKAAAARCETDANGVEYEYAGGGCGGSSSSDDDDRAERREEARESAAARQAHNLNEQGRTAYANEDYAAAANYFSQAMNTEPDDDTFQKNLAMALNNEGAAAQVRGDWQAAVSYYRSAVSYDATPFHQQNLQHALDAVQAIAFNTSGIAAYNARNFAQAADLFRRALQLLPNETAYRVNVGIALDIMAGMAHDAGNHVAAIDLYKMTLQYDPNNRDAKANLPSEVATQQRLDDAAKVQAAAAQSVAALATVVNRPSGGGQQSGLDFVDPSETLRDAPAGKPSLQAGTGCGGSDSGYAANGTCSKNSGVGSFGTTQAAPTEPGDLQPDNTPAGNGGDTRPIPQAANIAVTTQNNPRLGIDTPAAKVTEPIVPTGKPTLAATPPYTPEEQAKLDADPDLKILRQQQSDAEAAQKTHASNAVNLQQQYDRETDKDKKAALFKTITDERSAADIAGNVAAAVKLKAEAQEKKVVYGAPILQGPGPKTDLGIAVPSPKQ